MTVVRAFIGMGSNLGDRVAQLELAGRLLARLPATTLVAVSPCYRTEPMGPVAQEWYLNAAAELHTELPPEDLLTQLHAIEAAAGRLPKQQRVHWGPRELDLDILLYDQQVIDRPELAVPHPGLAQRWFVLRPLADLDGGVRHPVLGKTIAQLLCELEEGSRS